MKIEYRLRPVTRYVVTKWHEREDGAAGVETRGEYDNADTAYDVAYALCKAEHEKLGYPPGDERVTYPRPWPDPEMQNPKGATHVHAQGD